MKSKINHVKNFKKDHILCKPIAQKRLNAVFKCSLPHKQGCSKEIFSKAVKNFHAHMNVNENEQMICETIKLLIKTKKKFSFMNKVERNFYKNVLLTLNRNSY